MKYNAKNVQEYLEKIPEERKPAFLKLRETILNNLPEGFEETLSYDMLGYVVPHTLYPDGYHVSPDLPLPFVNIASQKNYIALYHMGVYTKPELLSWFEKEYAQHCSTKLDMGKSCIRFRKPDQIPFELIGELMRKISIQGWIQTYEKHIKR